MHKLKLIKIGNSVGVVLPKEVLATMNVAPGDELVLTRETDGVHLTPYSADIEKQIEVGRDVMRRYRHTLKKLAE